MFKGYNPDPVVKAKLLRRLRGTTPLELEKWTDQIMTGLVVNLREIQKGLSRGNTRETLVHVQDSKEGALALLAAMVVMEENLKAVL